MTLTRLVLAWLPVTLGLVVVEVGSARGARRGASPLSPAEPPRDARAPGSRGTIAGRVGEGGVLTLIASLWFDSLGTGEWWLLFPLLGTLVALSGAVSSRLVYAGPRAVLVRALLDAARYLGAGALLAWRLG